ncbi:MAG: hypothetical protein ABFC77_13820 [Thermoguttaceae bacterium]
MATPKEKFSLSTRDCIVLFLGFAVVLATMPFREMAFFSVERLVPYVVGTFVGLLLISILFSWLAFRLCKRSQRAASITFLVFVAFGVMGQVDEAVRYNHRTFDEKAVLSQILPIFHRSLMERVIPYQRACEKMGEMSPLNPIWLKKESDLDIARNQIVLVRTTNSELRDLFSGTTPVITKALAAHGVPVEDRVRLTKGIVDSCAGVRKIFATMRDQDDIITAEFLKACDLLEEHWGYWHLDANTSVLVFDSNRVVKEFNAIRDKISKVAEEQRQSQVELRAFMNRH